MRSKFTFVAGLLLLGTMGKNSFGQQLRELVPQAAVCSTHRGKCEIPADTLRSNHPCYCRSYYGPISGVVSEFKFLAGCQTYTGIRSILFKSVKDRIELNTSCHVVDAGGFKTYGKIALPQSFEAVFIPDSTEIGNKIKTWEPIQSIDPSIAQDGSKKSHEEPVGMTGADGSTQVVPVSGAK